MVTLPLNGEPVEPSGWGHHLRLKGGTPFFSPKYWANLAVPEVKSWYVGV